MINLIHKINTIFGRVRCFLMAFIRCPLRLVSLWTKSELAGDRIRVDKPTMEKVRITRDPAVGRGGEEGQALVWPLRDGAFRELQNL